MNAKEIKDTVNEIVKIESDGVTSAGALRQVLFTEGIDSAKIDAMITDAGGNADVELTPPVVDGGDGGNDLLDGTIEQIEAALVGGDKTQEELEKLHAAEKAGKTRKGVMQLLGKAFAGLRAKD